MTTEENRPHSGHEDPYALALQSGRAPAYLRLADGRRTRLPVHRWCAQPTRADRTLMERCVGPVLDVGCGPGRLCRALLRQGVFALGIDVAPHAVARTIALGGTAQCRSVFDPLPGEGDWQTLLLADGNIGIGGDPHALVRRCAHLISPMGVLLVEVDDNDVEERCTAWFEDTHGHRGPPFPWARLGAPALRRITDDLGLSVTDQWKSGPRSFLALGRPGSSPGGRARRGESDVVTRTPAAWR
ncbi:methyltransferase type 11 [Streptomyces albospinus]|uniref:Methyltransferase type 11 n=1 Tax=Streptomyces albospinus TaxID=285515 RepID=A0ABQ2VR04_9ACTN|nr:methyltransferase domain-containing protein [Streptomyces albospinus]GGU99811.1 methyltransferase type 11 [Streptomyces albospinus]